jgi:ABC-type nickel/cobalt efflux system permease component RcnA
LKRSTESDHPHGDAHSHPVTSGQGTPLTWRSLLALGFSGGLLPCPSALVVMLGAIALDRVGFGLLLVLAFSLGPAGVLTGIGLMLIYAGRHFSRLPVEARLLRFVPAASALFIVVAGLGITLRALAETGILRF